MNEKSIRIVQLSGKKKEWRMWSKQFLAVAGKRDYKEIIEGTELVPKKSDTLDLSTDEGKKKMRARKANDNAYHDLVLANQNPVAFNLVDKAISTDLPDGDAKMAWDSLKKKYESKTPSTMVSLADQFHRSKLENVQVDPEVWIVYLEILQTKLENVNYIITEKQLIIHIMHHLPAEYENIIDDLEKTLNDAANPLELETVKERLHSKWEKLVKNDDLDDDDNDDVMGEALFAKAKYKGSCRICGKIGHKGEDCYENPNRKVKKSDYRPYGSYNSGFKGNCNFCNEKGHIERFCKLKQSSKDRKAFLAKKKSYKNYDEMSLFAMYTPQATYSQAYLGYSRLSDHVEQGSLCNDDSNDSVDKD